jgi:hypothetical protein
VNEHLRMSAAEREQAAGELGEHYVQGRLTAEEHSERLDQIWAARTRAELTPIFQDLPGRYAPQPFGPPFPQSFPPRFTGYAAPPRRRTRLPAPLMAILAFLVVVTVLTHLPIILFGLLVWFIVAKHHRPTGHRRW